MRLVISSYDPNTFPAVWTVTVAGPAFEGQPWMLDPQAAITNEPGRVQVHSPRDFRTPIGVPLAPGDYTAKLLRGLVGEHTFQTVDSRVLALVSFRIAADGSLSLIWW